jgi:hypothetical protein
VKVGGVSLVVAGLGALALAAGVSACSGETAGVAPVGVAGSGAQASGFSNDAADASPDVDTSIATTVDAPTTPTPGDSPSATAEAAPLAADAPSTGDAIDTGAETSADAGADGGVGVPPCALPSPTGQALFDVGHASSMTVLKQSGDRVLSEDWSGHWVLWDTTHRSQVTSGDAGLRATPPDDQEAVEGLMPVPPFSVIGYVNELAFAYFGLDMAGGTVAAPSLAGLTLLSAIDGHVLQTLSLPELATTDGSYFGLATDGSYVWVATTTSLTAWSTSGQMLVTHQGNYSGSSIFAAPTELRVGAAPTPQGNDELQIISTVTGKVTKTQALGDPFESWFPDGSRLLTASRTGGTPTGQTVVSVYTVAGQLQATLTLPFIPGGVLGQDGFVWTENPTLGSPSNGGTIEVFAIGGGGAPVWSSAKPVIGIRPSGAGHRVGFADPSATGLDILDLSGSSVTETVVALPANADYFDADLAGHWVVSADSLVFDSSDAAGSVSPRSLDCGAVLSITGAPSGQVAIATLSGQTLYVDLQPGGRQLLGAYPLKASAVQISSDGHVLAASGPQAPSSLAFLDVVDLRSGQNTATWAFADGGPTLANFALSRGGTTIGLTAQSLSMATDTATFTRTLANATTGTTFLTDVSTLRRPAGASTMALSPDGTLAAIADFSSLPPSVDAKTNIYKGNIVGTAEGYPVGWLDDSRLVVKTYTAPEVGDFPDYEQSNICDPQGHVLARLAIPQLSSFTPVGTTQIYAPETNTIYNVADGSVAWTSADSAGRIGDVAGGFVVLFADHRVLVEAH